MKKLTYLNGDLVGRCTFIAEVDKIGNRRAGEFKCINCDNTFTARIDHVKANKSTTCRTCNKRSYHGESDTRLYHIWEAMKQRCTNSKHPKYKDYGERGIKIVPEWDSYEVFRDWALLNGYSDVLTIDRIDVNNNYSPENCRWETATTQAANKQFSKKPAAGFTGIELSKQGKFTARLRKDGKRVSLGTYSDVLQAIFVRDSYIINNKLPNKRNLTEEEVISLNKRFTDDT